VSSDLLVPGDVGAEEAVIAAMLLDDSACARVQPIVKAEDFYREHNGLVFDAAQAVWARGDEVTVVSVAAELSDKPDAGTPWDLYLIDIVGKHLTGIGVETHARLIARDSFYRRMITASSEAAKRAYSGGPDPTKVYSDILTIVLSTTPPSAANDPRKLGLTDAFFMEDGIPTGIPVIDRHMGGLQKQKVSVVAAGSSVGKSMLAVNMMWSAAKSNHPCFVASMEMDIEYDQRAIKHIAGVPFNKISSEEDHYLVEEAALKLDAAPIRFWSRPRITIDELWARCYAMKVDIGLDLVVVDYLQLMALPPGKESEATKIGMITSRLKQLAMELECHVMLLAQMNRGAASELRGRDATRDTCLITNEKYPVPFIESLKGSGSIEQDADHVIFIARHADCYQHITRPAHASVVLAKNRGGVTGSCLVKTDMARSTIRAFTSDECYDIAGPNMEQATALRVDQGYWND